MQKFPPGVLRIPDSIWLWNGSSMSPPPRGGRKSGRMFQRFHRGDRVGLSHRVKRVAMLRGPTHVTLRSYKNPPPGSSLLQLDLIIL